MSLKWKIIFAALIALAFGTLVFIIKAQFDLIDKQKTLQESVIQMKELQDGWIRSSSRYVTKKDLSGFANELGVDLNPIQEDIKKLNAEMKGLSHVVARTSGVKIVEVRSTSEEPRENPPNDLEDKYGYLSSTQKLELKEPIGEEQVPVGSVEFKAWKEKPWSAEIVPREYSSTTVLSRNEEGRAIVNNKFQVKVGETTYEIPITQGEVAEVFPDSEFRFNPRLFVAIDGGIYFNNVRGEITPNLQMSLFSYGKTKVNADWTFLGLGVGYATQENNLAFILSPVRYNISNFIPFTENLFFGPSLTLDLSGNVAILGGIGVRL